MATFIAEWNVIDSITSAHLTNIVLNPGDGSISTLQNSPVSYSYSVTSNYYITIEKGNYFSALYNLDLTPLTDSTFSAKYSSDINATWCGGVYTGVANGGATVLNGKLDLNHGDNRYVEYDAAGNADFQQTGTIRFKLTPNYSTAPLIDQAFFSISSADLASINLIALYNASSDGSLALSVYDSTGTPIISGVNLGIWTPILGTEYEFEVNIDITSGATRFFINGIQFGSTIVSTGSRNTNINKLAIGQDISVLTYTSNFSIHDFMVFDSVQHVSNYTDGYTIPERVNSISLVRALSLSDLDTVWDAAIVDHNTLGTFGAKNQKLIPSETIGDYHTDLTPITSVMALDSTAAKELTLNALAGVVALDATVAKDSTVAKDATVAKEATSTLIKNNTDTIPLKSLETTAQAIKTNTNTIPNVKAKTDQLQFTITNDLQARINDLGVLTAVFVGASVWDTAAVSHIATGTFGHLVNEIDIFGTDNNRYIDNVVYTSGIMSSCRVRVYSVPASVGTDNDVLATFLVTSTQLGGKMTTYKEVEQ